MAMGRAFALYRQRGWKLALTGISPAQPSDLLPVSPSLLQLLRSVKTQSSEVRGGNVLELDGKLYQVMKQEYTQGQGRQLGNVHLVLKDLLSGSQRLEKLRPSAAVERVRLEERQFDFLYKEGDLFCLMDPENFEQLTLDPDTLGDSAKFITTETPVKVSFYQGQPVTGSVANFVPLTVQSVGGTGGGDTLATLETGFPIKVPSYISAGDKVVVDTQTGKFVKRA